MTLLRESTFVLESLNVMLQFWSRFSLYIMMQAFTLKQPCFYWQILIVLLSQCSLNFLLTQRELLFFTTQLLIILVLLDMVFVTV